MNVRNSQTNWFLIVFVVTILMYLALFALTGCAPYNRGKQGLQGSPAKPLPVLVRPATASECPYGGSNVTIGTAVTSICNGATGSTGSTGSPGESIVGPAGSNGIPGTVISIVQFCPGVVASYPTTFPEVGLCIDSKLYAVYSANEGFLAYIPPGLYESNAVGSACTFTVLENCVIH